MKYFEKLRKMYLGAPIQKLYPGIDLTITENHAVISLPTDHKFHHAGGSMHGSVYFRLLDDACYFAAMSREKEYFILTKNFNIAFKRPHVEGVITAKGEFIKEENGEFYCKGELFDKDGIVIASGSGVFVKHPKMPLIKVMNQ